MEIKIVELKGEPVPASGSRAMGYLGRFTAGTVIGWAVLVPREGDVERLKVGAVVDMEPMYEELEAWSVAEGEGPTSLVPLATPGDYRVTGALTIIGKNTAAIVEAAGFAFDVTTRELPRPVPADGSRVAFTLRGLSLCEEES